ncbi:MAG TPA: hypothetical protein PK370_00470 [Candidatus Woesebacteria bacterium]|nr:hypothetical protein [Candidatus Woesebacteria bacterium]HPJ16945.1 hypothetical protein [Candidatus Woesebacteria bacterium]
MAPLYIESEGTTMIYYDGEYRNDDHGNSRNKDFGSVGIDCIEKIYVNDDKHSATVILKGSQPDHQVSFKVNGIQTIIGRRKTLFVNLNNSYEITDGVNLNLSFRK